MPQELRNGPDVVAIVVYGPPDVPGQATWVSVRLVVGCWSLQSERDIVVQRRGLAGWGFGGGLGFRLRRDTGSTAAT